MLPRTFQHIPGIRQRSERNLWNAGIVHWDLFRSRIPPRHNRRVVEETLDASAEALARGDAAYFGRLLPQRESWRIYREYHEQAAYLDIETTGSIRGADAITCISVATRRGVRTFVKDRNLQEFPDAIRDAPILVTFNGAGFDIPFLMHHFGDDLFDRHAHFDVCVALRRAGRSGGLKKIEKELGVPREDDFDGVDGGFAVWLWQAHRAGDPRALPTLERYCSEDVLGLPALAARAANELLGATPFAGELPPLPVPRRMNCYMSYSATLLNEMRVLRMQQDPDGPPEASM